MSRRRMIAVLAWCVVAAMFVEHRTAEMCRRSFFRSRFSMADPPRVWPASSMDDWGPPDEVDGTTSFGHERVRATRYVMLPAVRNVSQRMEVHRWGWPLFSRATTRIQHSKVRFPLFLPVELAYPQGTCEPIRAGAHKKTYEPYMYIDTDQQTILRGLIGNISIWTCMCICLYCLGATAVRCAMRSKCVPRVACVPP